LYFYSMRYWLIKSDPDTYGWEEMKKDKRTFWDGVRNYAARNFMREMKKGDRCLFYHSVKDPHVVGIVEVVKEAYPDHTAEKGDWSMVDVKVVKALKHIVPLQDIKAVPELADMVLLNNSRLSVQPVEENEYRRILELGGL
jgi:predicted RNA-binding protein with PUA-like domain